MQLSIMTRLINKVLLFFGLLLNHSSVWSMSCNYQIPDGKNMMAFISVAQSGLWSSSEQCWNTCYFEAYVSQLEAEFSRLNGYPTAISRGELFVYLLKYRVSQRLKQLEGVTNNERSEILTDQIVDFGSLEEMFDVVNQFGEITTFSMQHKTPDFLHEENKLMQELHDNIIDVFKWLASGGQLSMPELTSRFKDAIEFYQKKFIALTVNPTKVSFSYNAKVLYDENIKSTNISELSRLIENHVISDQSLIFRIAIYKGDTFVNGEDEIIATDPDQKILGYHFVNLVGFEVSDKTIDRVVFRHSRVTSKKLIVPVRLMQDRLKLIVSGDLKLK